MKGKFFLVLVAIVLGWLAFSNPNMVDFQRFIESRSQGYLEDELGDNVVGRALAEAGSSIAGEFVEDITARKNYIFFSFYNVGEDDSDGASRSYLGIAGEFIRVGSTE